MSTPDLMALFGTSPMPPLPLYMLTGISFAVMVITAAIILTTNREDWAIILALKQTGQLALSFYVAHVIIGMGLIGAFGSNDFGSYSLEFSLGWALLFCLCCVVFAVIWRRRFTMGPLEWLIRKITG